MSFATPHAFATNEVVTAANLNTLANWNATPRLRLDNTGGLTSVTSGTPTTITWTVTDIVDTDGMHSTGTNPTRVTLTFDGVWRFAVRVAWGTSTTGTYRSCQLFKNGSFLTAQSYSASQMTANACNGTAEYQFTERAVATDYFEFKVAQDTAGTVSPVVIVHAIWSPA